MHPRHWAFRAPGEPHGGDQHDTADEPSKVSDSPICQYGTHPGLTMTCQPGWLYSVVLRKLAKNDQTRTKLLGISPTAFVRLQIGARALVY